MTCRELRPEEWSLIVRAGIEPFATVGLPEPGHWKFVGVFDDDFELIGVSSLYDTVHNDWSLLPEAQGHPAIVIALWRETKRLLDQAGVSVVHATVAQPDVQAMIERLGYRPAPGTLYILDTADATLNERI